MLGNSSQRSPQALPYGYQLHGQYQIEDVLGQGGFGITYAATDLVNLHRVAIKELFPSGQVQRAKNHINVCAAPEQVASFEKMKNSFSKETAMLVQLQDIKDVIRLFHAFNENGTSYYVMEYLSGKTLSKYLSAKGPLDWTELSAIIKPVLTTLSKLHQVGVIHRDVSPDNIFLQDNGEVKLIDFGNVRSFNLENSMTAYVKGNFAPWEQFTSAIQQGPYTDVYSLCVTIYFSLTGKLPPKATERIHNDQLIPLRQICTNLPDVVCRAVEHGMAVRACDRTQKIETLSWELFSESTASGTTLPRKLYCQIGQFEGRTWVLPIEQFFSIGRSVSNTLCYPPNAKGVSRMQVKLYVTKEGRVLACDECSTYGTMCISPSGNYPLHHGKWFDVSSCMLFFGAQEQYLIG